MRTALAALVGAGWPTLASAHGLGASPDAQTAWGLLIWILLVAAATVHGCGVLRLVAARSPARRMGSRPLAFRAGLLTLAAALLWPVEQAADASFAGHMVQHMLLVVVAAPLLVAARPLDALLAGLPRALQRAGANGAAVLAPSSRPRALALATATHGLLMWGWHAPAAFEGALASEAIHVAEHATMLGSAVWFWWVIERASRNPRNILLALICVFITLVHTGMLGGLITFAPRPLYAYYAALLVDPVADQQLAGLIMWVPAGLAYLGAGLWLLTRLMHLSQQTVPPSCP